MQIVWSVVGLDVVKSVNSFTNVVKTVYWKLEGIEDTYQTDSYGSILLEFKLGPADEFIAYEDLTEETVIGWVKAVLGQERVQAYEASLQGQMDAIKDPVEVNLPLPWLPQYTPPQELT